MRPELPRALVNFLCLQLECTCFIRLRCYQEILERSIRGLLHSLLKRTHESIPRMYFCSNFGILKLEQKTQLACYWVAQFRDLIPRSPNLDYVLAHRDLLPDHTHWEAGDRVEVFALFSFSGSAARQVGLVLPALGVSEVGAIVLVDS